MKKLNLGCGHNVIDGYVNIDVQELPGVDLSLDFIKNKLPFEDGEVSEVVMYHTIEHVEKKHHYAIFSEIRRVLGIGGELFLSYPDFFNCVERLKTATDDDRQFWEATIYGRQLVPSDYHVCVISSAYLLGILAPLGFAEFAVAEEDDGPHYQVLRCTASEKVMSREKLFYDEVYASADYPFKSEGD
tara:strand:- start:19 stop:579 length:561 start_codon:yes stop_codon:yes gene_type:complete